jgi:cytoskeletal protein RodZ
LTYSCICGTGSTPDLARYKNTLPDYICQANFAACIKAHPDDAVGQGKCKTDIQANCGTLDVANFTSTPASSTSKSSAAAVATTAAATTAAASPTVNAQVTTTSAAPSATKSSAAGVALAAGNQVGAAVMAAGLLAVFGYML